MVLPLSAIRGFVWGFVCACVFLCIAVIAAWPEGSKPDNFAIGTGLISIATFQKQLEEVSTRKGMQKVTRKDVKPTLHAVAPAGASSIVERFVAAAEQAQDTIEAVADAGTGEPLAPAPAARDTVCLGVGGSQRKNELTLLSACVPGSDGVIDRYRGRNFDWSYVEGRPVVSVTRGPDLASWAKWTLLLGAAVYGGIQVGKRINE